MSDLDAFIGKRVEVVVTEDGPVEGASPSAKPAKRRFGTPACKVQIAEHFDSPLPADIQRYFDGDSDT